MLTATSPFNCGVYRWLNTATGKSYIGSSFNLKFRRKEHVKKLKSNSHYNPKLQRAWNKYGDAVFEFEVLTFCRETDLLWQEQLALDAFDAVRTGYNISFAASAPMRERKHSNETKVKMSAAQTGRVCSEESKLAISKAKLGVPFSSNHKQRLSQSRQGHKQSEEHKKNVIEARTRGIEKFSKGCQDAARLLNPEYRAWRGRRAAASRWGSPFTEPAPMKGSNYVNGQ